MNPNAWLEDSVFVSKAIFPNLIYFEDLCKQLAKYLRKIPIPVLTSWDWKNKQIYFRYWKYKKAFRVSSSVSIYDYIYMLNEWLTQYFPQYMCLIKSNELRTHEESVELAVEQNIPLENVIDSTVLESGIMTREYLGKDQFKLQVQRGKQKTVELRCSKKPLQEFKKELIKLKKEGLQQEVLRTYIHHNSIFMSKIDDPELVEIQYPEFQLVNFFILHRAYLSEQIPESIDVLTTRYGKFLIRFEDIEQKQHCVKVIAEKISEFVYKE